MRPAVAGRIVVVSLLACYTNLGAQPSVPASHVTSSSSPTNVLTVPAGESLVLELKTPLNSQIARKGDRADFSTTNEVLVGDQVAIPRDTIVRATVTQAKRAGTMRKGKLELQFDEIVLPGGTIRPLSANVTHAAWSNPRGEHGKGHVAHSVMTNAAAGALLGVIFGGGRGAIRGAAAGAAIGAVGAATQRGPELDYPPGMMFEIELTKPIDVPVAARAPSQVAANQTPPSLPPSSVPVEKPQTEVPSIPNLPPRPPETNSGATAGSPSTDNATLTANRTPPPLPSLSAPPVNTSIEPGEAGGFKLKVDVDLVLVEATVRDESNRIVDNLTRENFRLYEDGVEQQITHFSRDELPLAVALVVDRSGSMGPVIEELRRAAYQTLSLLKPEDQVALFAFAATPERLEYLTTDRQRIADDIATLRAGGGTNITDALFDAVLYLGRAAPNRRHAVILVSDNEGTVRGYASDNDVIRLTHETESVIYSIKVGGGMRSGMFGLPLGIPGTGSVSKMARQSGGELIDANNLGSVRSALADVIARLKHRYTLGYYSTNPRRDGTFRRIEIRIVDPSNRFPGKYTVYARAGYYARTEQAASRR